MGSAFVHLAELAHGVLAPDSTVSTSAFLELCRQVLPVIGASLLQALACCMWLWPLSVRQVFLVHILLWAVLQASLSLAAQQRFMFSLLRHADKLGTGMVIVRSDIGGNINRLDAAQARDPARFADLFQIPLDEVKRGQERGAQSDTNALLWLKRCHACLGCCSGPGLCCIVAFFLLSSLSL